MKNVIIIGTGPAGVSAALYVARAGINTTVIGEGIGALAKAKKIENYYGFAEPVSGQELSESGISQAKRIGAEIINAEVVGINYDGTFAVKTTQKEYHADAVIIATGSSRQMPNIKGFSEFEGHGISYCAVCDAFFYKGKDVAVLGCCEYALAEALELLQVVRSVTILTDGVESIPKIPPEIKVITKKIKELSGKTELNKVIFEDGKKLNISGLFVAIGVAGSAELAKKLGANVSKNIIAVDNKMATNIPGLFAAGDCTGGMLQIAKAVYQGAVAGTEAVKFLKKN